MSRQLKIDRVQVKGVHWVGKSISLDGYDFVDCLFTECTLRTSTDWWTMTNCRMEKCQFNPKE